MNKCVFINCPYDKEYIEMYKVAVFTLHACGYNIRLACENPESGENRLERLKTMMTQCSYHFHDISRLKKKDLKCHVRGNLILELGLSLGLIHSKKTQFKLLICDKEKYLYQRAISDLAGLDAYSHDNNNGKLCTLLSSWLLKDKKDRDSVIFAQYSIMLTKHEKALSNIFNNKDIDLSFSKYLSFVKRHKQIKWAV